MMRLPLPVRRAARALAVLALALLGAACSTLPTPPLTPDEDGCHAWMAQLDAAVARAAVADVEAEPIAGFPGLRADRVAEALRPGLTGDEPARAAWLQRAAALDRAARRAEIANLPAHAFPLGPVADRAGAVARTDRCREATLRSLRAPGPLPAQLAERATVPARYSLLGRTLGLYPLLRWPFFAGVQGWQNEQQATVARWATAPPPLQRYHPASDAIDHAAAAPPRWPPPTDALGLPQPDTDQARALLAWHAPVFDIEQRGPFDRFGAPRWGAAGALLPQVDAAQPVVFQRIGHMRLQGRWHLQLVYALWFPERPAKSGLDLLAGTLDGVVVRLTLGDDGQPLLMDTIHACGCYHMFFPGAALRPRADAPQSEEWMFSPAPLPPPAPGQRLVVRIASASHYVNGVAGAARDPAAAGALHYGLRDDDELRSLPLPAGAGRRSLFGPDGIVAGTERGERFLFWPMGIASAGAMRQWGHHATAFVGRRHFDDVDLLERRFEPAAAP